MAPHSSCWPFAHALPTMMTLGRGEVKHRPADRPAGQPRAGDVTRLSTSHSSPTFCMVTVTWSL